MVTFFTKRMPTGTPKWRRLGAVLLTLTIFSYLAFRTPPVPEELRSPSVSALVSDQTPLEHDLAAPTPPAGPAPPPAPIYSHAFPTSCDDSGVDTIILVPISRNLTQSASARKALSEAWAAPRHLKSSRMCLAYIVSDSDADIDSRGGNAKEDEVDEEPSSADHADIAAIAKLAHRPAKKTSSPAAKVAEAKAAAAASAAKNKNTARPGARKGASSTQKLAAVAGSSSSIAGKNESTGKAATAAKKNGAKSALSSPKKPQAAGKAVGKSTAAPKADQGETASDVESDASAVDDVDADVQDEIADSQAAEAMPHDVDAGESPAEEEGDAATDALKRRAVRAFSPSSSPKRATKSVAAVKPDDQTTDDAPAAPEDSDIEKDGSAQVQPHPPSKKSSKGAAAAKKPTPEKQDDAAVAAPPDTQPSLPLVTGSLLDMGMDADRILVFEPTTDPSLSSASSSSLLSAYKLVASSAGQHVRWIVHADVNMLINLVQLRKLLAIHGTADQGRRILESTNTVGTRPPFIMSRGIVDWIGRQLDQGWLATDKSLPQLLETWMASLAIDRLSRDALLLQPRRDGDPKAKPVSVIPQRLCDAVTVRWQSIHAAWAHMDSPLAAAGSRSGGNGEKGEEAADDEMDGLETDDPTIGIVVIADLAPAAIKKGWEHISTCDHPCGC
ncbi:hypothetical protein BC828DRAFT_417567 [Blastocladiella britannica]|nr:hypothetical protein BC828DRAFT_417567 [Blastocladiella britannica]